MKIRDVANLARIELTPEEEKLFEKQLNDILKYIEKLSSLDTKGVEPMSHAIAMGNVFRQDSVKPSLSSDEALKNAPSKEKNFFKVPKIIE
jgi:aspartyl-tRNA(Asn)/glutamyl-tRNA(Gln) amidotransferase subunit C